MRLGLIALTSWVTAIAAAPAADEPVLRISVTDAETGAPIPEFRILAGTDIGRSTNGPFVERSGAEAVNWQPHTTKVGKGGEFIWPMARSWDKTGVRVEADGYIPQRFIWIEKKEGGRALEFKLEKDPGVAGTVLLPDGEPAPAALIALGLIQRNVRIEGTSLKGAGDPLPDKPGDRWRRPTIVETNAKGKFTLATETDPASVVVAVHPKGICEMPYAEFEKTGVLALREWGRVEGTVTIGHKPGAGEEVTLSIQRETYGYPDMLSATYKTKCADDGSFVFEKVPPGLAQVSLFDYFPKIDPSVSFSIPVQDGAFKHVEVLSGEVTRLELGGKKFGLLLPEGE